jgi:hypothetical protein
MSLERPHPEAIIFDDGKMAVPVSSGSDQGRYELRHSSRGRDMDPKQNNAGQIVGRMPEGQFTKVLVECHEDALFSRGKREDDMIRTPRPVCSNPQNIVACLSQAFHGFEWDVFVG